MSRRPFMKSVIGAGLAASMTKGQGEEDEPPVGKKLGWALDF